MTAIFSASERRSSGAATRDVDDSGRLTTRRAFDSPSSTLPPSSGNEKISGTRAFESVTERITRLTGRNQKSNDSGRRTTADHAYLTSSTWRQGSQQSAVQMIPSNIAQSPSLEDRQHTSGPQAVVQGFVTAGQLECAFGYAYYRGNGQYTRLLPVDELPYDIQNIPRVQGPQGLIILPAPRSNTSPRANIETNTSIQYPGAATLPLPDPIQGRIDQIVATTPVKREKIYCDKWVHSGTCAFTQVGCKFKHEMPLDKATQHQLGLFQGLPEWYKREHAVELRGAQRRETTPYRSPTTPAPGPGFSMISRQPPSSRTFGPQLPARAAPVPQPFLGSGGTTNGFGQRERMSALGGAVSFNSNNPYEMLGEWKREEGLE